MGEPSPQERLEAETFAADSISLTDLAADLRRVLEFQRPEDAVLCILAAAQAHLGPDVLPEKCLAYVSFNGPKSSGKTVATEAVVQIAGGTMIAGGTLPAMVRILTGEDGIPPRALGIDEVDNKGKLTPDLEGILRTGNRWHADYPISIPKGKGWETCRMNVGGFKAFNYSGTPDDALASRTLMVSLRPVADPKRAAALAVESLFNNPILDDIRGRLFRKARVARARWSAERMESHMKEPAFRERVARLDSSLPRGKQLGAVLLAVADAMEWADEAETIIAGYVAERHEELSESEREILAQIVRERLDAAKAVPLLLGSAETLGDLNKRLKDKGLNPINRRQWPTLRASFAIGDVRRAGGVMLTFGPEALKALGVEATTQRVTSKAEGQEEEAHRGPNGRPPDVVTSVVTPAIAPLDPSPLGNATDRLRGGKNIRAISDHVCSKLRWDGGQPDSWIARGAILALQLPEDAREDLEAFVAAARMGLET